MNGMKNGMKAQRKPPVYNAIESVCWHCGKVIDAPTKRRKFCNASCRSAFHRKIPIARQQIETAQVKLVAYAMQLKQPAIEGDRIALSAYREVDKILTDVSQQMKKRT